MKIKASLKEAFKQQWDHWFYKDSDKYREEIKMEQLAKAAEKYPKPFDPMDWTAEELVKHAMQENYDQQNYIYGLYLKIKRLIQKNQETAEALVLARTEITELKEKMSLLHKDLEDQTQNTQFWFMRAQEYNKERLNLRQKKK